MEAVDEEEDEALRAKELEKDEPLLQENPRRFVMFPIEHPDIWQFYKKAEGRFVPIARHNFRNSYPLHTCGLHFLTRLGAISLQMCLTHVPVVLW